MAGKMLAHFLQSGTVFDEHHTFSIMGFSLGSQVAKSCINRLHKLGRTDSIHNVYFLAGATFIRQEKILIQRQKLAEVVSGRITNCHTENDESLRIF
jgi:hypothetical protein